VSEWCFKKPIIVSFENSIGCYGLQKMASRVGVEVFSPVSHTLYNPVETILKVLIDPFYAQKFGIISSMWLLFYSLLFLAWV
jgi:hypothetical protein